MSNELDMLKQLWSDAKRSLPTTKVAPDQLIAAAEKKRKNALYAHYGNIMILLAVLAGVIVFFFFLYPFNDLLSRTGVSMMVGGLVVRIAIETISIANFQRINMADQTLKATSDSLDFYHFRRSIHGPVTVFLVGIYLVGMFLLLPEVAKYVPMEWIGMFVVLAISGTIVLIRLIGKGIREEMNDLWTVVELKKRLSEQE